MRGSESPQRAGGLVIAGFRLSGTCRLLAFTLSRNLKAALEGST